MRRLLVLGLLAALSVASPVWAQREAGEGKTPVSVGVAPPARAGAEAARFAADREVYARLATARSYGEIAALEAELKAVFAHAPAHFPMVETQPGLVIVRDSSQPTFSMGLLASIMAANTTPKPASVGIAFEDNVYGAIGLALGSLAIDRKDFAGGLAVLEKAATMQPDNPGILSEQGHALAMLGRNDEALAVYTSWERDHAMAAELYKADTARIKRGVGYVLTEQKRYEEAEAAYKASLILEPDNPTALNELTYLAQLQGGAPTTEPVSVRGVPVPTTSP